MNRAAPLVPERGDARPLVARDHSNRSVWVFAVLAALGGTALFAALEARRGSGPVDPLAATPGDDNSLISPPPPLALPGQSGTGLPAQAWPHPEAPPLVQRVVTVRTAVQGQASAPTYPAAALQPPTYYGPVAPPVLSQPRPAVVYQAGPGQSGTALAASAPDDQRVAAGTFANPATTVPQGAMIQAVLETALDSNRPGLARAIISRDVRGFDGTKVLIPRGSRLYGEYKADLASGQNRALIQWTRLMRPDGVTIALDSPSADPLGRAGVKGKVNSHFFARFGGAILQSTLDVGVALASRQASGGTVVVGLPGSTQTMVAPQPEAVRPTLKVAQGTAVSVFVARDLDFTDVER